MLKEVDRLMQLADPPLDEALKAYLNALNCNSKLSSVVGPKIEEVFHLIKEQKRFAEEQQGIAKQQTKIAQQQRTIAQIEAIRAKASLYANLATREKQKGNFESGMRLAMKAWQMLPDPKPAFAYEAFTSNGFAQRDSFFMLTKRLEQNSFAAFAPDNQTFLTIQDSIIHHWKLNINL